MAPSPEDFERHSADKAGELRLDRVSLGSVIAGHLQREGKPHKLLSDRGFDMLIHNLGLAESVAEEDVDKASLFGDVRGRQVPPSKREQQAVQLLADGMTVKEAAGELGMSRFTFAAHLRKLAYNLGAANREETIAMMVDAGMVVPKGHARRIGVPRQRRVLELIVNGLTTDEIGDELGLHPNTVRSHLTKLQAAMRTRTREETVAVLVAKGTVRPERRMPEYADRGRRARSVAKPSPARVQRSYRKGPRIARGGGGKPPVADGRREKVLRKITEGLTNAQIAAELRLTEDQVKDDVRRLLIETGSRNRVALAVAAVRLGLDKPSE